MVHIGSEEYYKDAFEHLNECDKIFFEGADIQGISKITDNYDRLADKLGLVTQDVFDYRSLKEKLIHTDLNQSNSKDKLEALTFMEKIKFNISTPLTLFFASLFISRTVLAKAFMTSSQEYQLAYGTAHDEEGTMENLIMNEREQIIFQHIIKKIGESSAEDQLIGIMYGAGHMKRIARFLIDRFNYTPMNGKYLKVFDV